MNKPLFGSSEWLGLLMDKLNTDAKFNALGKNFAGKVLFTCASAPDVHEILKSDIRMYFDIAGGKINSWKILENKEEVGPDYELSGDYPAWKAVTSGKMPLRKAVVLTRKLKLKGKVSELAKYMGAWERIFQVTKESLEEFCYPDDV